MVDREGNSPVRARRIRSVTEIQQALLESVEALQNISTLKMLNMVCHPTRQSAVKASMEFSAQSF